MRTSTTRPAALSTALSMSGTILPTAVRSLSSAVPEESLWHR